MLSGDRETRELYRHDRGFNERFDQQDRARRQRAALAQVHYGTGPVNTSLMAASSGYVMGATIQERLRRSTLNDGTVVEVHRSESRNRLFYRVGILSSDYEISWGPSQDYDDGATPTLERLGDGRIRERHNSPSGDRVWQWSGGVNRTSRTVRWTDNIRSSGPLFNKATSTSGARRVETLSFGSANTLLYSTSRVSQDGSVIRRLFSSTPRWRPFYSRDRFAPLFPASAVIEVRSWPVLLMGS